MKKFDKFKTVQLIILIVLTAIGLYIIFTDKELYRLIATNPHVRALCTLLWAICGVSFFFIFLDFSMVSTLKREYRELDYAVSSDPVSGIANRYSCDSIIEKYLDKPLPKEVGCIMFVLTNIQEINQKHGHLKGNELIRDFSGILQTSALNLGFVGRNGGNNFLAIIEKCNPEKLKTFIHLVDELVEKHNAKENTFPICYKYGTAFNESDDIDTITDLIALSFKRTSDKGGK